jgi:5-formyltetrahydrofolate cyclo-ligase
MSKKTIRMEINRFFNSLSEKELETLSLQTTGIIKKTPIWEDSKIILAFLSFGKEFNTEALIKEALLSGKKVAVPRIYDKQMKFHYIESLDDDFEINRWGIREPHESSPCWKGAHGTALMLTPGLAFNKKGGRLGRGGGFYDRFLSSEGEYIFTLALCFEQQIRDDFPVEKQDYIMDAACSNQKLYLF